MKLVHWPLMGGLLHLIQRGGAWAGPRPTQGHLRFSKCNSPAHPSTVWWVHCGVVVEYRTRNRDVVGSTHTRSTASNLEQVANLLCAQAQANSTSYSQRNGK